MKFPAYWAKAVAEETDPRGQTFAAACWRWSDVSAKDAHRSALAAATVVVRRLMRSEPLETYAYGRAPVREEVLQRHTSEQGELSLAVTRNAYGVLVLNTARAMFIDLDFDAIGAGEVLRHWLARLVGRGGPSPEARREAEMQDRLEGFLRTRADWGLRMYRTCAGVRLLVTHALFDPVADSTRQLLESLGCDPLYVRLCRDQQSFRARLTPKPWRCNHTANRVVWPHETAEQRERFRQWQSDYDQLQARYATCRFLGTLGRESIHPHVAPVIKIHDQQTRCDQALPLA